MSQIEPYYDYSQMPPDDDDFEPMQMRSGSSWQPGWRPPSQQRPPYGPPWPGPGPGGGGWPFWGYWGFRLRSAWRDVKFLNKLIGDIVNEMISDGIIAPGPNAPDQGPGGGGIKGVTDGSDAGPGMVGEFLKGSSNVAYTVNAQTDVHLSPLVITPGDWDIRAGLNVDNATGPISIYADPVPTGLSNNLHAAMGAATGPGEWQWALIVGPMARGSFSVPTLLPFRVVIDNAGVSTGAAGTATLWIEARRMR